MNKFETILVDILKAGVVGGAYFGPVLVHSDHGIALFNASEGAAAAIAALFAAKSQAQTAAPAAQ